MAGELILIVEDNEKNRKLERDILQFHGYQTMEAETGEDGVALAQATPPALILMDIQLPGMSGIDALRVLRADERTRAIPVIAVTASAMTQDRQKIMSAGFDAYQAKPIDVNQFVGFLVQQRHPDRSPGFSRFVLKIATNPYRFVEKRRGRVRPVLTRNAVMNAVDIGVIGLPAPPGSCGIGSARRATATTCRCTRGRPRPSGRTPGRAGRGPATAP